MKKFFLLVFAVPFMMLTSCGDDKDTFTDETEQGTGEDDSKVEEAVIIEPVAEFGKDVAYIKAKETRTPAESDEFFLIYKDNGGSKITTYVFNPNLATIEIQIKDQTNEEVVKFYKNRYKKLGSDKETGFTVFTDDKNTMAISVGLSEVLKCVVVNYMPYIQQ